MRKFKIVRNPNFSNNYNKVIGIKNLRYISGMSLKEAKEFIEKCDVDFHVFSEDPQSKSNLEALGYTYDVNYFLCCIRDAGWTVVEIEDTGIGFELTQLVKKAIDAKEFDLAVSLIKVLKEHTK
jgi:hypothetical protein